MSELPFHTLLELQLLYLLLGVKAPVKVSIVELVYYLLLVLNLLRLQFFEVGLRLDLKMLTG